VSESHWYDGTSLGHVAICDTLRENLPLVIIYQSTVQAQVVVVI